MPKTNNKHNTNQRNDAAAGRKPTTRKAPKQTKASKSTSNTKRGSSAKAKTSTSVKRSGETPPQLSSKKYSVASKNAAKNPAARSAGRNGSTKNTRRSTSPTAASRKTTRKLSTSGTTAGVRKTNSAKTASLKTSGSVQNNRRASAKGMSQKASNSAFRRFITLVRTHPRVMVPIILVVAIVLGYCVVDLGSSLGKIHPGVRVQGVDVGGLTIEEASGKLEESLSPQLAQAHITLYENADIAAADGVVLDSDSGIEKAYAEQTSGSDVNKDGVTDKWVVTAETIGAYINGDYLARQAFQVGRQGNLIADRFGAWFGGKDIDATVSVSDERFNTLMAEINSTIGKPIEDSTIEVVSGKAKVISGSDGRSVERTQFIDNFSRAAFNSNKPYCTIPMQMDTMHISAATAQNVADQVTAAIANDVTIAYNADSWVMNSNDLGSIISVSVLHPDTVLVFGNSTQKVEQASATTSSPYDTSAGTDPSSGYILQAYVDQGKMDAFLVTILGEAAKGGAQNASFDTSSGEVVIIESVDGSGPDRAAAELAMQDMLFGSQTGTLTNRTITLVDTTVRPEFTTEMAQSMGIKERLATWSIPLSGTSDRIHNIQLLCQLINNSLVAPGQEWSFNETTGERTAEKGFGTAPVIINGKHEDQLGGGICQVATCVYNCACFSGLGILERTNHDFYISSYDDDGFADATVSWEKPDLRWENDMSTYILITADASDEDVVISFWGTKDGRTVECQRGEWKEGEKYKTIQETDNSLPAGTTKVTQTGQDGRSIDIRYLCRAANGQVLHDVTFHSVYSAQNEIISVGPAVPAPDPAAPAGTETTGT